MTASRSARERKAASEAGPLARVKIDLDEHNQFLYKISCTECVVRDRTNWSAYRPGDDNGFMAAMDRWVFHLNESTPGPRRHASPTSRPPSSDCTSDARSRTPTQLTCRSSSGPDEPKVSWTRRQGRALVAR